MTVPSLAYEDRAERPDGVGAGRLPSGREMLAIGLWGLAWIGLWHAAAALAVNFGISAWYPPAAISLYLLIRYGPAAAPAVFAASLLAGSAQWRTYPDIHEGLGSLGHTLVYLLAAQVYRARLDGHRRSIRPRSVGTLLLAAFLASVLSSVVGNLNLDLASGRGAAPSFARFFTWAVGDLFGVLSLCPALLFARPRPGLSRAALRRALRAAKAPAAALAAAVALAAAFAVIARGSEIDFRLVSVVGVGVYSVIVCHVVSPRSAVIYLFLIAGISAAWLSTAAAPEARSEFAFQICTFLVASFVMIALSMERMAARVGVANRRMRIRDLSDQRDALDRRIRDVEAEFAQIAHEMKTPLGGIIGLLELAEGGVGGGDGRAQAARHFAYIRGCAGYLSAMVDDAFDVARIARGRFEPMIAEFELAGLIEELALISRARDGEAAAVAFDPALGGLRVRSDRNRLLQILINLVVNAARYADRRGAVTVTCAAGPDAATVSVSNPSATMTKARLDAFIAGGAGPSPDSQGLGLGLPLVGRLAAGIGAQLSTDVRDGVVTISVTVRRA